MINVVTRTAVETLLFRAASLYFSEFRGAALTSFEDTDTKREVLVHCLSSCLWGRSVRCSKCEHLMSRFSFSSAFQSVKLSLGNENGFIYITFFQPRTACRTALALRTTVQVTLRLMFRQPTLLGVEPFLGIMSRFYCKVVTVPVIVVLQCPSDEATWVSGAERTRLCYVEYCTIIYFVIAILTRVRP